MVLLVVLTPWIASASPYSSGYSHGCDDGKLGFHKYLNTPGNGVDYHTPEFMQGYDKGYKACFSPNGTGDDNKIHSQSDTGGTFVSCNKLQHSLEYCNPKEKQAATSSSPSGPLAPFAPLQEGGVL